MDHSEDWLCRECKRKFSRHVQPSATMTSYDRGRDTMSVESICYTCLHKPAPTKAPYHE